MALLKFKKDKEFDFNGEYHTEANGIKFTTWKNDVITGLGEWYFKRDSEKDYPEEQDFKIYAIVKLTDS